MVGPYDLWVPDGMLQTEVVALAAHHPLKERTRMAQNDAEEDRRVRPFADFLHEHNRGSGHRQAGEQLNELVGAVLETGKKGTLTLTVTVEPVKGDSEMLSTTVVVASKVPTVPEKAAFFYTDGENNLQREDPKQRTFESLREVERPEAREVAEVGEPVVREAGAR